MYFSKPQLKTIFQLQTLANNAMSTNWLTGVKYPYYRASWLEGGEAVADHLKFKWWKQEAANIEQAILELIDILHFAASDVIRKHYDLVATEDLTVLQNLEVAIDSAVDEVYLETQSSIGYTIEERTFEDPKERLIDSLEQFVSQSIRFKYSDIVALYKIFNIFELSSTKAYNIYVGKNTLNLFRTSNGQKENTYIKVWFGEEDNVYLERYTESLEGGAIDTVLLTDFLTTEYAKVLAAV